MAQPKPFQHHPGEHDSPPAVLTPVESRQGVVSGRGLMILTSSLLLAGAAFAIVYGVMV